MKQELLFCAELYRILSPFIDRSKPILFALDGAAAKSAYAKGNLKDPSIPDMCFQFIGNSKEIRIEAKVLDGDRHWLSPNQAKAWGPGGDGKLKPMEWVATDRSFDTFYSWSQAQFRSAFGSGPNKTNQILAPEKRIQHKTIEELALHIVKKYA